MQFVVNLKDVIGTNLLDNTSIVQVFERINKVPEKEIIINFAGVKQVSPIFAQEFIFQARYSGKNIIPVNQSYTVQCVFNTVLEYIDWNETQTINRLAREASRDAVRTLLLMVSPYVSLKVET